MISSLVRINILYGMDKYLMAVIKKKRIIYCIASVILLIIEILIGMYAHGWIRNYLGDVLVVILLYTLFRTVLPAWP